MQPPSVVVGSFGQLYDPLPRRTVRYVGKDIGFRAVTVSIPKGQVHT